MPVAEEKRTDAAILAGWVQSPRAFIRDVWGLIPQPAKPEFAAAVASARPEEYKPEWFGDKNLITGEWEWHEFKKGKHLTWMQCAIILAVENAINGRGKRRISVRSGHGIGKSAAFAMLIHWALFCHAHAQIPCTSPTREQMYDILWKELDVWHSRMRLSYVKDRIEVTADRVQIKESPKTWFARARTGNKENPEALAGVHGDFVMAVADEASGVFDKVFEVGEGAFTGPLWLQLLISNPTRLNGYFYQSHTSDDDFVRLAFSSLDSPIVDRAFVERIQNKYGETSDEFRVRVRGEFPKEDAVDADDYAALFLDSDVRVTRPIEFVGEIRMGIDPAGEGSDLTSWVIRDRFRAGAVQKEQVSDGKSIARVTLTLMERYGVKAQNIDLDNFGVGADALQELALAGVRVNGRNVGDHLPAGSDDASRFLNKRAQMYWRLRDWLRRGGELTEGVDWVTEGKAIRFRRELSGKIQIMPKRIMKKKGLKSPNHMDALMLTFWEEEAEWGQGEEALGDWTPAPVDMTAGF